MNEKKPIKITVEYEDGSKKELSKGAVAGFEGDSMKMDMVEFEKMDLVRLTYGLICGLHQMGLSEALVAYTKEVTQEKK